jgi:hypothetical protein
LTSQRSGTRCASPSICIDADALQIDRMAHRIGAVAESAATAVTAVDRFRVLIAGPEPASDEDDWDNEPRRAVAQRSAMRPALVGANPQAST